MKQNSWILGGAAAVLLAGGGWWWMASHAAGTAAPAANTAPAAAKDGMIPLTAEQMHALGLTLAVAASAQTMPVAELPAQIMPQPNARVAVAAQFPGVITRIFVVAGQDVAAGQSLATVASRDMVSLTAELARARARQSVTRAQAARLGQLAREGIIAPARADEAVSLARQSDIDVGEQARLIGLVPGGRAGGAGYTLSAPISGRISAMSAETGKAVDPAMAPFVIDGGGPLQVTAQLPERLLGAVKPGMIVRIGTVSGTVTAVGQSLDPATRSATVTATVPAGSATAGSATAIGIEGPAPAGAVRIPVAALSEINGGKIVFVAVRGGVRVRPVTVSGQSGESAVITKGLAPGERVAASGVSELATLAGAN
ncbi:efflux RND transporter periplasmic adaptor subunit [Novosphingobium sp.]|uniref:efflux RND transporter periplasmic adaptor subunit n=1 Tax=Novosphingobium sp. TaxID=1874826 RepID=UPI00263190BF|nr:efflux RND transporter periplasmic adaptor subunit [Novosphingobium sp.]